MFSAPIDARAISLVRRQFSLLYTFLPLIWSGANSIFERDLAAHCGLPTEELKPLAEKLLEVSQELPDYTNKIDINLKMCDTAANPLTIRKG
jgi:hypothetical protein